MTTPLLPTDDQIERGLTRLLKHVEANPVPSSHQTHQPARRRARRISLRIGVGAIAVAAATALIVFTGTLGTPGGGASAQAAEVLNAAATATINSSDLVVPPGQYLKVETVGSYTSQDLTGTAGSHQYNSVSSLYIPADRSDQWVWVRDEPAPTLATNPNDLAAATKSWLGMASDEKHRVVRGHPEDADNSMFSTPTALESYSRDPKVLLEQIGGSSKDSSRTSATAWVKITDLLQTGLIPADLRAALYKTAVLIPGISLLGTDETLNGRSGDAIGLVVTSRETDASAASIRQTIIIDPDNGQMIGRRTVALDSSGKSTGASGEWTAVQTTVSPSAP